MKQPSQFQNYLNDSFGTRFKFERQRFFEEKGFERRRARNQFSCSTALERVHSNEREPSLKNFLEGKEREEREDFFLRDSSPSKLTPCSFSLLLMRATMQKGSRHEFYFATAAPKILILRDSHGFIARPGHFYTSTAE